MSTYKQMKKKPIKYSKGYRLRPETHDLVNKIQETTKTDFDTIISNACKMYYRKIKKNIKLINNI